MELELVARVLAQLPPLGELRDIEPFFDVVVPNGVLTQNADDPEASALVSSRRQRPLLRSLAHKVKDASLFYPSLQQPFSNERL